MKFTSALELHPPLLPGGIARLVEQIEHNAGLVRVERHHVPPEDVRGVRGHRLIGVEVRRVLGLSVQHDGHPERPDEANRLPDVVHVVRVEAVAVLAHQAILCDLEPDRVGSPGLRLARPDSDCRQRVRTST
jgi:hypothetical protein